MARGKSNSANYTDAPVNPTKMQAPPRKFPKKTLCKTGKSDKSSNARKPAQRALTGELAAAGENNASLPLYAVLSVSLSLSSHIPDRQVQGAPLYAVAVLFGGQVSS